MKISDDLSNVTFNGRGLADFRPYLEITVVTRLGDKLSKIELIDNLSFSGEEISSDFGRLKIINLRDLDCLSKTSDIIVSSEGELEISIFDKRFSI